MNLKEQTLLLKVLRMVEYHRMIDIGRVVVCNVLSEKDILGKSEVNKKIINFVENLK